MPNRPRERLIVASIIVALTVILAITCTTPGNAFRHRANRRSRLALVLPFGVAMLMLEEWRKAIVRRAEGRSQP